MKTTRKVPFNSIRWRVLLPVFILIVSTATLFAYLAALQFPAANVAARQLIALLSATAAAGLVIAAFLLLTIWVNRLNRITRVASDLVMGQRTARTGMKPTDEIGRVGRALDVYADYAQEKQDELRFTLRRKRREVTHLLAVLEAMPDGVIVQDIDGRVVLMNDNARKLLGSQRVFRSSGLHELTAVVTDVLGEALAPGLYTLGSPQRVDLDGKMLSAQAAAVIAPNEYRLGTVIILRDVTEQIKKEMGRDRLLRHMERDVQQPLEHLAKRGMVADFARDVSQHAAALQRMIVDMRDMAYVSAETIHHSQQPIVLDMLVWAVTNEWRQVAVASNLALQVTIDQKGLHVLGDERRLRWAIGNVLDNAIKYTPPGGTVTLEIKEEQDGMAILRIRDNGTGITAEELPLMFTRFYRGNPRLPDGRVIRVPGLGQGLYVSRQIIEAHGGSIKIKSKVGVGTAVYFSLPLTASEGFDLNYMIDLDGETVPVKNIS